MEEPLGSGHSATVSTFGMPVWEFHFIFWVAYRSTSTLLVGVLRRFERERFLTACERCTSDRSLRIARHTSAHYLEETRRATEEA